MLEEILFLMTMDLEKQKAKRNWGVLETKAFLKAYLRRKSEFVDIRKRKNAMKNVLEDLLAQKILTDHTTVEHLKVKLRSLLRAYKTSKNAANKTGAARQVFPYEDLMNEIFGRSPVATASEVAQLGFNPEIALDDEHDAIFEHISSPVVSIKIETASPESNIEDVTPSATSTSAGIETTPPGTPSPSFATSTLRCQPEQAMRLPQSAKDIYYERKLAIMQEYYENKTKQTEEYLKQKELSRERHHREKMLLIQSLVKDCKCRNKLV